MILNQLYKLILILFICSPCYASSVENLSDLSENKVATLNDNFKALNDNANRSKNLLNSYFGSSGILGTANGGTGKNLSTAATGTIPYFSSTGVVGNIGIGTSGYFLKSNGTIPLWSALPADPIGYNLVSTTNVSDTTTSGNISVTATKNYLVVVNGKDTSGGSNTLGIRVNGDTGGNYTSGYSGRGGSAAIGASSSGGTSIIPGTAVNSSTGFNMVFHVMQDSSTSTDLQAYGTLSGSLATGGGGSVSTFGGEWNGAATPTSFSIIGSGNWTGTVYLYELKTS